MIELKSRKSIFKNVKWEMLGKNITVNTKRRTVLWT